ncbi:SMP-30/gluconolactonase/LRE family protein [Rhodopirellula sp.]|nr:SMP-30/gluconolactonase/LRE family protein [Rhodopirellula sp.]
MNGARHWVSVWLVASLLGSLQPLAAQDMPLSQVLIDGENWQSVSSGHQFTDGLTTDAEGNLYFADVAAGTTINRIGHDGKLTVVAKDAPRISGMHFGPDGRIYACQGGSFGRIVAFDLASGKMEVIADNVKPNDLVVTADGHVFFTETAKMQISHIPPGGQVQAADVASKTDGAQRPNGIALTPDQGTLAVSDYGGRYTWVWRLGKSGGLSLRQPYITLRTPTPDLPSKGDGMTTDAVGRYYVTSSVGLQMFDPTGRMGGVIAAPTEKPIVSVAFAGPGHQYLYVAAGDEIFRRKTKSSGIEAVRSKQK